jgi:hypothetical protein
MGPGRGRLEKTTFTTRSSQKQNGAHHSKNTYEAPSSQNDEEDNIVTCLDCNTDFSEEETNFYNVRDACHGHV